MRSKFSIGGHPLHPLLVVVPIGLFVWAFVSNLIYVFGGRDETWYNISLWTGIAAIVAAVVAALPGIGDFLTIVPKSNARAIATGHMALNGIVVVLFAVAAVLMWNDGALVGGSLAAVVVLHGAGVALLAVSGWLGGEMVFRHHLAVVPHHAQQAREEEIAHRPRQAEQGQDHVARPLAKPGARRRG